MYSNFFFLTHVKIAGTIVKTAGANFIADQVAAATDPSTLDLVALVSLMFNVATLRQHTHKYINIHI